MHEAGSFVDGPRSLLAQDCTVVSRSGKCKHLFERTQVLTKAALLAYERLHVARGVLERDWTKHAEKAAYTSKVVAAWHFDVITSGAGPLSFSAASPWPTSQCHGHGDQSDAQCLLQYCAIVLARLQLIFTSGSAEMAKSTPTWDCQGLHPAHV